jgi:predicted porin
MKKSLIALAVAGVVSAPAFAATSNVDIYGVMNIAIQDTDVTGSDLTILDNTSRIGFKGSEDLGGGLKAIWQIESALGGNGTTAIGSGATLGTRNTFVGLAGGFGTVLMGRHDTPYKLGTGSLDIFGDTIGDYNLGRTDGVQLINNTHDHRNGQALAYISPTVSGFHAAVAVVMSNGEAGSALNTSDTIDAISATAVYANGPLFASLSYQDADAAAPTMDTAWKLGVGYTFGDTKVGFVYEDIESARDSWLVNVAHTMGPIVLKAQYGQADVGTADQDAWALGADYNLSKRTSAYVVYANGDDDAGDDVSGWNLGVKHSF